jgi:hypothetical protein
MQGQLRARIDYDEQERVFVVIENEDGTEFDGEVGTISFFSPIGYPGALSGAYIETTINGKEMTIPAYIVP